MKNFVKDYFEKVIQTSQKIDFMMIEKIINYLKKVKINKGRIFFIGVGGSAGNASHAVNDFRKLCLIESYSPSDNVSELTARINDEGWNSSYKEWLSVSNLNKNDAIFILSVGGGNKKKKISLNIVEAIDFALKKKSIILGIIGKNDGYAMLKGNAVINVPEVDKKLVTPLSESYQSIIWHCIVSHPKLKIKPTKW